MLKQTKSRKKEEQQEPSGEAESLWGRINPKEMGTRFQPAKAPTVIGDLAPHTSQKSKKASSGLSSNEFAGMTYKPKSKETRNTYEGVLALVSQILGDQPSQYLRSAADDVIVALKENASLSMERLGSTIGAAFTQEVYSSICSLVSRLDDYSAAAEVKKASEQLSVLFEGSSTSEEEEDEEEQPEITKNAIDDDEEHVDLDMLAFTEGGHLMSNRKCILPDGSEKITHEGYEEIHVPPPQVQPSDSKLLSISALPSWTHPAFAGTESLNRIQSQAAAQALDTSNNILVCAPTGAGKTNIALLTILRLIRTNPGMRAVYIAPMKALVQEMVSTFSRKLAPFDLAVAEMTGDQTLTRAQITDTFLIVTTPEKYDIITRKLAVGEEQNSSQNSSQNSFTDSVKLVIIDEIHLLHDERGPALESLIARFSYDPSIRILGLSATLPNYQDVAKILHVPTEAMFYFDSSYRPCPLAMKYVGLQEKKPTKRIQLMDKIVYEKLCERVQNYQVLIFVHSRKEAARTARNILQHATEKGTLDVFERSALLEEASQANSRDLRELLPKGFGIHHAGLSRKDRSLVETMFATGSFNVLISTATLAWGVNLPAHTVIIKGTQVYSPEKGKWIELSPQDTLQMLGRAGRPQYDIEGEGIILTTALELQYYLSLTNMQLPIESQMISKLIDCVNAEIVTGRVRTLGDAMDWLERTYLNVRMQADPLLYGCSDGDVSARKRLLLHSACAVLAKGGLAVYDHRNGTVESTDLGRISAHYYITYRTMSRFACALKPHLSDFDLLRTFSLADEFKNIPVRAEEKTEVAKLLERVPVPIRETAEDPLAKINALLQCYISRVQIDGLALTSDLVYISNSAGRLMRALYEICLCRSWSKAARLCLDYCKVVEKRQWRVQTPLRQFVMDEEILRRLERKDFPFQRLFDLDTSELSELVRMQSSGPLLKDALNKFPRLSVSVKPLPRRHDLLEVSVEIKPEFTFDYDVHGSAVPFQLFVEDTNRDTILAHRNISIKARHCAQGKLVVDLQIPLAVPVPPVIFVCLMADHWLGAEKSVAVNLMRLTVPTAEPEPTPVLDIRPVPMSKFLPGREGYLSVPLSQASVLFSKTAVYATGNSADYLQAQELLKAMHPGALFDPDILQVKHANGPVIYTKFDYSTELGLLWLLLKEDRPQIFVLLESASDAQAIAEWIGAEAVVNFTPTGHLPIESEIGEHLIDFLNLFISSGHARSKEDCVNVLARTFLYRRLLVNPFYYGATGDISDHLSALVEESCEALGGAGCLRMEGAAFSCEALGHIAAHYNVLCATIEMASLSLTASSTLRNVFDILIAAEEFADFDLNEDEARSLYKDAPLRIPSVRFSDPHHSAHIYLQAYLSELVTPPPNNEYFNLVMRLIRAVIDVAAAHSFCAPIQAAIQLLQLVQTRQWPKAGPFKQFRLLPTAAVQHPSDLVELSPQAFEEYCTAVGTDPVYVKSVIQSMPNIHVDFLPRPVQSVAFELQNQSTAELSLYCVLKEGDELCALKQLTVQPHSACVVEMEVDEPPRVLTIHSTRHVEFDFEFDLPTSQ